VAGFLIATGQVILIPLIILAWKGKESEYVKFHAQESLNFQISMAIYCVFGLSGRLWLCIPCCGSVQMTSRGMMM
jgi:uncharacterized Tic20 family protein